MIIDETTQFDDVLMHYGILRKSGRYPWGSGGNANQRHKEFLDYIDGFKKEGYTDAQIAKMLSSDDQKITSTQLRALKSIAVTAQRKALESQVYRMKEKGMSNVAIGRQLGINESSVRSLLDPSLQEKARILESTSNMLKENVEKYGYLDIGAGTENHIGISNNKLKTAVAALEEEGYTIHYVKVQQLGTGKETTVKVLAKPGVTYSEVYKNQDKIGAITDHSDDGGRTYDGGLKPPKNVATKRVAVRYAEDGGADMDGVIELRRGVKDLDLGNAQYAQVRIAVNGTHYLKGMAMYADDLPDGVDIRFNTNKSDKGDKLAAMKELKRLPDGSVDMSNPFGATIKPVGGQKGALNIVNEEGDWGNWSKSLSSQMLSKQRPSLAREQLAVAYENKRAEYDEIMSLNNPAVQKKLLQSFADDADSSAVHLKAASLPRQATHVILPVNSVKETEIYAPNYRNGEKVVLVRYPHGGKFEIPELTVNNRNADANRVMKNARDAVGINAKVAARLSGADFDGDTVLVIPNNNQKISTAPALRGLKDFDPQTAYPSYEGMKPISAKTKQLKMGDVSNLITDMTIGGATDDELARAVRHSMVVIDAEKHKLNWKQSAQDNGIAQLKEKYQGDKRAGASTLISKASSEVRIPERRDARASEGGAIDRITGERRYVDTGATYTDRNGKVVKKTTKVTRMSNVKDARELSSGQVIEEVYANHANKMKALANQARKAYVNTPNTAYSPSAAKTYAKQVGTLNAKLNIAEKNAPRERQAQLLANSIVAAKRQANPHLDPADLKKIKGQALTEARARTGAKKDRIEMNWDEWNAIQAGAITNNKLNKILDNTDVDVVKQFATPRENPVMSDAKVARAKAMAAAGYPQSEIADALGVPTSTLNASLNR